MIVSVTAEQLGHINYVELSGVWIDCRVCLCLLLLNCFWAVGCLFTIWSRLRCCFITLTLTCHICSLQQQALCLLHEKCQEKILHKRLTAETYPTSQRHA